MKYTSIISSILFAVLQFTHDRTSAQNTIDTRLMSSPAVSSAHIAFIYSEDLWVANKDGSNPRRLTIDEGVESNPVFSPDGSIVAFSAEYDGNTDVYVVPATGGVPQRLTWHPTWDIAQGFTPDGKDVLFTSSRTTYTNRHAKLYTIPVSGGRPEELPIPTAFKGSYSSDGQYIAYSPLYEVFNQWKNYRGGTHSRIWIYNTSSHEVSEIPKPPSGSNDANPQWMGNTVYFRSDRNGEFNLFAYDLKEQTVTQLTDYDDFPVLSLSANGNDLIYERAGYLYFFDTALKSSKKLTIGIATDLLEMRPRYVSGNSYIRSAAISPSGARAVFDYRGEIVTVPAKKGDVVNITQSPGTHEKYPQWSPDGKHIAYFSDQSGEYQLHIKSLKGTNIKTIPVDGAGFYAFLHWSPDSKRLCFVDNGRNLYLADVSSGKITKIGSDELYIPGAFRELFGSWSHDSKWVTYTVITSTHFEKAYVYSVDQGKSYALSDGLSNVSSPIFDPGGKYIYMLASTDAGPVINWFDQSNLDMELSHSIYLVTLQKELVSPLAKENDEEKGTQEDTDPEKNSDPEAVSIDWENIEQRIIDLPISPGIYSNLSCAEEGKLFYLSRTPHNDFSHPRSLRMYDFKEREDKEIMQADWFEIAAGGKKMLFRKGRSWGITEVGKKPENGDMNLNAIQVKIEPVREWKNIFHEAWRVNRDYFYDPGMHGLDWDAMKEKYRVFLPDVTCRSDLYRVMQWMFSELAVGHHRFSSRGDKMNNPARVSGGLLGADYEIVNNRYRLKKIYGGLNWTPELRSPLTEPGVNVKAGEYLLAVNGGYVTADQNLYSFFENTAGKIIELTVGPNANGSGSRTVRVVPVSNERALRNRDWIEGNIRKVDEATDGQVAYVYVPNTTVAGHEYFKRYFFPQVNKKAVIIDERYNGGGQLADYYIDLLKKPYQSHWNFRYGNDLKAPSGSIQGPKVMLIDETAGSGGDYLPWMFRKFKVGKLIGKRTWGGLVGVLGYPEFIDGGSVTAPNVAFWNEDGFRIENEGIAPDIEVEQWPEEVIDGRDPQLEKAIEVVLEELKNNPPTEPERPDYPVRVRKSN
ncbi:peptidase S41 [Fulvivirga sp. M361]|uniref:S41 family peptidase n=1 Tax=Fulvivirga sp. M361 TaxID=2594266 RepID=UPI00117A540E|nr:S41 family peptidase [Fulvivirga sp. M361]TRX62657.1 peptidase S41 [Fulvivirga sp. M361]